MRNMVLPLHALFVACALELFGVPLFGSPLIGTPSLGAAPETPELAWQEPQEEAVEESREQVVERWREALELDLAATVAEEGPPRVTGRGDLARDPEAVALVARALGAVGRVATAHSLLDGLAGGEPGLEQHHDLARAELLLSEDRLNEVIALLAPRGPESLRHPTQPEAWLFTGRAWSRGGEGARADVFLGRFLELAPLHPAAPGAWYSMARHAALRGDGSAAATCRARAEASGRWQAYLRARRLQKREDPAAPLPRLGLAQLWLEVGRLEEARAELDALTELHPDFARGWSHLGETQRRQGERAAARTSLDRALELVPEDGFARVARARLRLEEGQLDLARDDALAVAAGGAPAEDPSNAARRRDAWLLLARIEQRAGRSEERDAALARHRELGGSGSLDEVQRATPPRGRDAQSGKSGLREAGGG